MYRVACLHDTCNDHRRQAGTSRLATLAAVADVAGGAAALGPQLWLAQCLLARAVAALHAWVAGEAGFVLGPAPPDADVLPCSHYDCRPLREPGAARLSTAPVHDLSAGGMCKPHQASVLRLSSTLSGASQALKCSINPGRMLHTLCMWQRRQGRPLHWKLRCGP